MIGDKREWNVLLTENGSLRCGVSIGSLKHFPSSQEQNLLYCWLASLTSKHLFLKRSPISWSKQNCFSLSWCGFFYMNSPQLWFVWTIESIMLRSMCISAVSYQWVWWRRGSCNSRCGSQTSDDFNGVVVWLGWIIFQKNIKRITWWLWSQKVVIEYRSQI